jgi:hypothetical protein
MPGTDRDGELAALRERSKTIIRFLDKKVPGSRFLKQLEAVIDAAFQRKDLRGLRLVSRDVVEWATDQSPGIQGELDELLRERLGCGLRDLNQGRIIARILKRGRVANLDEYELLLHHADDIYTDVGKRSELEKVNQLLADFKDEPHH